jgi:hypothetical protein
MVATDSEAAACASSAAAILRSFGVERGTAVSGVAFSGAFAPGGGPLIDSIDPTTGEVLAQVQTANASDFDRAVRGASDAYRTWRLSPAPRRCDVPLAQGVRFDV